MQQNPDALRRWFNRLQPIYAELFNAAYVMCGNYDLAEYALSSAMLDAWLQNASGGMGFRERVRGCLRRAAFDVALSQEGRSAEFTWPGVPDSQAADPILDQLSRERVETQRLAMLRYGCGLSARSVARLAGLSRGQARAELALFRARCSRALAIQDRSRAEALISRRAKRLLGQSSPDSPQPAQVYRAFVAEVNAAQSPGHLASRIAGAALMTLISLLCAGAFWLFAVLVQPVNF